MRIILILQGLSQVGVPGLGSGFTALSNSYFSTSLFSRSLDATNVTTTCQAIAVSDFEETGNRHCQQIPFCHRMCEGDWLSLLMLCTSCALQSGRRQS